MSFRSLGADLRRALPLFALFAVIAVLVVLALRRGGFLAETVVLNEGPAAAAAAQPGEGRTLEIITLLPKDGIPAIFEPEFVDVEGAARQLADEDLVIGVSINGEHRAYGVAFLSSHEVVDDTVGGRPIAVTW